jgi:hypothetical protein
MGVLKQRQELVALVGEVVSYLAEKPLISAVLKQRTRADCRYQSQGACNDDQAHPE